MLSRSGARVEPTRRPWLVAGVSVFLAAHAVLAILGIYGRSVTSDETAHLTAGISYWQFHDYRLQPENGNLPQRWGALPALLAGARLEPSDATPHWRTSMVWMVAQDFLFDHGRDADTYLFLARCGMVLWSLASGLLIFAWSRSMWGDAAGLGSLALFAFSPTTLANAPLITSDTCAAFFLLAGSYVGWRLCLQPNWRNAIATGLIFGGACVAKFSAPLLIPVMGLMVTVTAVATIFTGRSKHAAVNVGRVLAWLPVSAVIAGCIIWTFFGWRYATVSSTSGLPPQESFYLPWTRILAGGGPIVRIIEFARHWHLLPEPFIYGFAFVAFFSAERGAFLAGSYTTTGWWYFFPFTFLVKSTVGELMACALLLGKAGFRFVQRNITADLARASWIPLVALGFVYGVTSILSHLNIGHRHILPLYLVLFVLSGWLLSAGSLKAIRLAAVFAIGLSAAETLSNTPNHLAFFNVAAGGPKHGWQLLADSSLDWGQDVAPAAEWVRAHRQPSERVYVSLFGTADPWHEGIPSELLSPYFSLGKAREWYDLKSGLYCVSATMLQDVYGMKPGVWDASLERDYQQLRAHVRLGLQSGWTKEIPSLGFYPKNPLWVLDRLRFARLCLYLRVRTPETVVNYTTFIFRLSQEELDIATERSFSELATALETAATHQAPR